MPFWTEPITHVGSLRLTTIQTRVRLPTHLSLISTGFLVGFKVTAFVFPLSRIDGQSLPRGRRFTSASEGREFHSHENQVIKDLIGLCSSSLTTRVISRKRIARYPKRRSHLRRSASEPCVRVSISHGSSVICPLSLAPSRACDLRFSASALRLIHTSHLRAGS